MQVAIPVVRSDKADLPHDGVDDARRNHEASLVVEQDILIVVALVRARDLADGVERARNVCHNSSAVGLPVLPFKGGHTLAKRLNHFPSCA